MFVKQLMRQMQFRATERYGFGFSDTRNILNTCFENYWKHLTKNHRLTFNANCNMIYNKSIDSAQ